MGKRTLAEAMPDTNADGSFTYRPARRHTGYEPDCADCPTPAECKAANRCAVMESVRPTAQGADRGRNREG